MLGGCAPAGHPGLCQIDRFSDPAVLSIRVVTLNMFCMSESG